MQEYTTFYFEKYTFDAESKVAQFHYSFGRDLYFTETLTLHVDEKIEESDLLDRVLFNLHLALGISYWKAYCSDKMVVKSGKLTRDQADFWNTVYTKGMGEFFYQNQIDFHDLVRFPFTDKNPEEAISIETSEDAIVPIGGGKDSLVTIEALKAANIPFDLFTLGRHSLIDFQIEQIGAPHHFIERTIDPALIELNKQEGTLNGHVPISMIYAFTALLMATVEGHRYIVLSNEHSSNYGNVEYLGEPVNHQWSKSFEFETLLQKYMKKFITPDITYFSLLRPAHEILIAQKFSAHEQWLNQFTSCNRNFKLSGEAEQKWCGECAKCAFVFAILAPFVEKKKLVAAFGKNLFADENLWPLYQELLGLKDVKPFDCVGTPEEVTVAMAMAKEAYAGDAVMDHFSNEVLPTITDLEAMKKSVFEVSTEHHIPSFFKDKFGGF